MKKLTPGRYYVPKFVPTKKHVHLGDSVEYKRNGSFHGEPKTLQYDPDTEASMIYFDEKYQMYNRLLEEMIGLWNM